MHKFDVVDTLLDRALKLGRTILAAKPGLTPASRVRPRNNKAPCHLDYLRQLSPNEAS